MFGTLRLMLAALVATSHTIPSSPNFQIGVPAVIIFFMLSGFAMTGLMSTRFKSGAAPFFLERFVRLAPQYYFWLGYAMLISFWLKWSPVDSDGFFPRGLFYYLAVMPLGFQGYLTPLKTYLIAQASSLGVEISFYIFSPWVLRSKSLPWIAAMGSLLVYLATDLRWLPEALYTYYSAPGPLVFYVLGHFLYRKEWLQFSILSVSTATVLIYGVPQHYNIESLTALLFGTVAIVTLSRFPAKRWDTELGNASYGCFLGHGCVSGTFFWFFGHLIQVYPFEIRSLSVLLGCIAGYASFALIERPTVRFRKSLNSNGTKNERMPLSAGLSSG